MNTAVDRLRLVDIGKSFGPVRALDGVDMAVERGTVHGLLGENGAGKSTLLRILSGVLSPSSGHVEIDGAASFRARAGGGPPRRDRDDPSGAPARSRAHRRAEHVPRPPAEGRGRPARGAPRAGAGGRQGPAPLDPTIDPAAPIRTLKVAQRQIVEIARAMMEDAKVLAMDEPTSSLTPAEFERLAVLIAELAAQGVSIIYVSHKMDEVFRVCETATILRDGRKVADVVMKDTTESAVIARMVGRELATAEHKGFARDEIVLEVSGLTAAADRPPARLDASQLHAPQGRGARHLGPGRRRAHGTPAPDRRRRPARGGRDPRRRPAASPSAARAPRSPPASAFCRRSANATASSRAAPCAATSRSPPCAVSRGSASCASGHSPPRARR